MNNLLSCGCMGWAKDWAYLLLRVVTGAVFAMHGWQKVQAPDGYVVKMFTDIGIPAANFFAPLVTYVELIGGIMIVVGALTHWVSKLNVVIMLVAVFAVHWPKGFYSSVGGYEYALTLLALSVFFMTMGAGKYSVDEMVLKKDSNPQM